MFAFMPIYSRSQVVVSHLYIPPTDHVIIVPFRRPDERFGAFRVSLTLVAFVVDCMALMQIILQPRGHTLRIAMPLHKGAPLIEDRFLVLADVRVHIERAHGCSFPKLKGYWTGLSVGS